MYKLYNQNQLWVETICYEDEHIEKVWNKMKTMLPKYFQNYLETDKNLVANNSAIELLKAKFNVPLSPKTKQKDYSNILQSIATSAIEQFDKKQSKYLEILDIDTLMEIPINDYGNFKKNTLRNKIPIIRETLQSKRKELDGYKESFNLADSEDLYQVVFNIVKRATDLSTLKELDYLDPEQFDFDDEQYTVTSVIGGGIKSRFLYNMNPMLYPDRNRNAIYALWYLVDKDDLDCKEGSEFLMIDRNPSKPSTQHNYFYPYFLFAYYANQIAQYLEIQYTKYGVKFYMDKKFVYVADFLEFIADNHKTEIDTLKGNEYYDY